MSNPIITIDGPAASGKGTVAKALSEALDLPFISSGVIFRALSYLIKQNGLTQEAITSEALAELIGKAKLKFQSTDDPKDFKAFINGMDITAELFSDEMSDLTHEYAALEPVHTKYVSLLQDVVSHGGVIDGRTGGANILKDAKVKIYLTADLEVRARRRYEDFQKRGEDIKFDEVLADLKARDEHDSTREVDPLKIASDAVVIDSTHQSKDETIAIAIAVCERVKGTVPVRTAPF